MKMLFRRLFVVLLALVLVLPMTAHAAGKSSPSKTNISELSISVPNVTYNGSKQSAKVVVTMGKKTLKEGKDYEIVGKRERKTPGTLTITVKGIGKYTGTKKVKFEVKKAKISSSKFKVPSVTYNGKKQTAKVTVTAGKKTLKEGRDYEIVGNRKRKTPGELTITVKGIGNYSGTKKVKFTVKKATPKITVNKVKTYKASTLKKKDQTFTLKAKYKGKGKISYGERYKKISVSKNGKVTLKKGLRKGTYKITIRIKKTKYYNAATKVIKIKVK